MTIREVIEMLTAIYNFLVELFNEYFGGADDDAEAETPEA